MRSILSRRRLRHVFGLVLAILACSGQAQADAAYGIYACEGPVLAKPSQHDWPLDEVLAHYPDLGHPGRLEFDVFLRDGQPEWTSLTRDELRAHCLKEWDAMHSPRSGLWDVVGPVFHTGACGPIPVTRPMLEFPRRLEFSDGFHPDDLIGASPGGWRTERLQDDQSWTAYVQRPVELSFMAWLAYDFALPDPETIQVSGSFGDDFGCTDAFTFTLIHIED